MDETSIYFNIVPNKIISKVGVREEACHCGAHCHGRWQNAYPMVIFRGTRRLSIEYPSGIIVEDQEKPWMEQHIMKTYFNKIYQGSSRELWPSTGILPLAGFILAHKTEVTTALQKRSTS